MPVEPLRSYFADQRRLRLGLVGGGTGLIGEVHANGARLSNRWDVVAGALSSNPERAKTSGARWQLAPGRCYSDYRAMAAAEAQRDDGIDAVAIVTPNNLHAPVALAFMEQGIDIICEKPLTAALSEVAELQAAQQRSGVFFGLAYAYASHPMVRQAKAMVEAGDLGELRQVHVEYFQDWAIDLSGEDENMAWRLDSARSGPSFTVADIGTHAEHLACFVSGRKIEALRADFHVTGAPKPMEDTAFMQLRMAGDVPGTLMVSQAMAGSHCGFRLRVCGSKATLEWCQETPEVLQYRAVGQPEQLTTRGYGAGIYPQAERLVRMPRGHPEALSDAWANLYLECAAAIAARRSGTPLPEGLIAPPTLDEGVQGMKFTQAAVASNASGAWVML